MECYLRVTLPGTARECGLRGYFPGEIWDQFAVKKMYGLITTVCVCPAQQQLCSKNSNSFQAPKDGQAPGQQVPGHSTDKA